MHTLYDDASCAVVIKPPGMATMTGAGSSLASLEALCAPWTPVHRLDNDTTGCVLLAKDDAAYTALRAQFTQRQVTKIYLALVHGLTVHEQTITTPIAHHARKTDRMIVMATPHTPHRGDPQAATTSFTTLQHCYPTAIFPHPVSWLRILIPTGVRHQIRAHLASRGHPIVGDPIYGRADDADESPHHLLHAWQLTFHSPATNEPVTTTAPISTTMKTFAHQHDLVVPATT